MIPLDSNGPLETSQEALDHLNDFPLEKQRDRA